MIERRAASPSGSRAGTSGLTIRWAIPVPASIVALLAVLGLALTACGSQPGPTPGVPPTSLATLPPSAHPSVALAAGSPTAGSPPAAGSPTIGGNVVDVDRSLLSFIPITGNGLIQTVDPDTAAQVAEDPGLQDTASALMIAAYIPDSALSSGAAGDDIAVVSVVRLRDPSADDTWFRGWRESYDAAACANAGGVARTSQTDIGTHTVFIGGCAGGSFTYHTRLASGAIVVSITSVGDLRLGQTVMGRLGP